MKKNIIFILIFTGMLLVIVHKAAMAAPGVGTLYVDPSTGTYAPNQSFTVAVGVNVGPTNKVNIVAISVRADSSLTVESCSTSSEFKKIYGKDTCSVIGTGVGNTVNFFMQAGNTEGPPGQVTLGTITLKGSANGGLKFVLGASTEIVVKQSDGQSVDYALTGTQDGSFQIGSTITNTPTPTVPAGNNDPYGFPIGNKDQLTINIGGSTTVTQGNGPKIMFSTKLFGTEKNPDIKVKLTATDLITQITPVPGKTQYGCDVPGVGQYFFENVPMRADNNGVYTPIPNGTYNYKGATYTIDADGWLTLVDVPTGTPVSLALKGPKHRNMKMVDNILLAMGNPTAQNFNWISILLEPGDLPDPTNNLKQDCTLNSVDLSLAISRIGSTSQSDLTVSDINFDGVINGNDISKIVNTMSRKPDDDR